MAWQSVLSGETVPPHGGRLVDLVVRGPKAEGSAGSGPLPADGEAFGSGSIGSGASRRGRIQPPGRDHDGGGRVLSDGSAYHPLRHRNSQAF